MQYARNRTIAVLRYNKPLKSLIRKNNVPQSQSTDLIQIACNDLSM